jgi:arylsulfatase A-like enzyme
LVDTLRPDRLSLFGHNRKTSPRLERFAEDAVVFEEAYAPSGWTKPSVATILTGLNPSRHGAVTRANRLPPEVVTLGELLTKLGYQTAAMVSNPNVIATFGFDQGFEHFYDVGSEKQETRADEINEVVFKHMEEYPQAPFFYYIHTLDPHGPYDPPPPYNKMFTDNPAPFMCPFKMTPNTPEQEVKHAWDKYDAEIAFNDEQFGALMDRLKAEGLYDDALIVFLADHGEEVLDHDGGGHGHTLYQELVRVPMVIKFPGNVYAGRRIRSRATLLDILPTILLYLKEDLPENIEGIDLFAVAKAADKKISSRTVFFDLDLERSDGTLNVVQAVLDGDYKYFEVVSPQPNRMLFNITADPKEKMNLIESELARAEAMSAMLTAHAASSGGVHLRLMNRSYGPDRVFEGSLETTGQFIRLRKYQCEEGDKVEVSPDGRTITLKVVLSNHPGVPKGKFKWVTDEDRLAFEVDPPDAKITIEHLVTNGTDDLPLFLGRDRRPAGKIPYTFVASDETLQVPDPGALFRHGGRPLKEVAMGAYLIVVPSIQRSEVGVMDEELRARLKALGYIGDKNVGSDEE